MRLYRINNLNLEQLLKDKFNYSEKYIKNHIWKYDFLITKIIFQTINIPNKTYFRFSQTYVRKVMGRAKIKGKAYHSLYVVREDLQKLGVIRFNITGTSDRIENKYTRIVYYQIQNNYLSQGWKEIKYNLKYKEDVLSQTQNYTGIYSKLKNILNNVSIDYNNAYNALIQLNLSDYKFAYNLTKINSIRDGERFFVVDFKSTNRVFHSFSNLKKELRKYLYCNNKLLVEVDVSNAQPLLFCKMIKEYVQHYLPSSTTDIDLFIKLCETGMLYQFLSEQFKIEKTADFKKDFFAKIFFSTEKKVYKLRTQFTNIFPEVSKIISFYKKKNYKDLAIELQRIESEVMINNVADNMLNQGIEDFITLHDAIYVTKENYNITVNIIKSVFKNKYDLEVFIK